MENIPKGKISWITCYNNIQKKKLFEGNKIRQRRQFPVILNNYNTLPLDVFVKYCQEMFTNYFLCYANE